MNKIMVWGIGNWFDKHISNFIRMEEKLGNLEVIGYVSKGLPMYSHYEDKPIIKPQDIINYDYDYIIVASTFFKEILNEATQCLNIPSYKLINGKVFEYSCFDWSRYIEIKNKKPSILSESCYGGYLYNKLGLQFNSPLINTRIDQFDYLKLIENFESYIKKTLTLVKDIPKNINELNIDTDIGSGVGGYPIFLLGDIFVHAVHAKSSSDYLNDWNRRIGRLNTENMIVMMVIENDEVAERFLDLKIKNKIGFYFKNIHSEDIIYMKEYEDIELRFKHDYYFRRYVHRIIEDSSTFNTIDFFKLLSGEKDFRRFR